MVADARARIRQRETRGRSQRRACRAALCVAVTSLILAGCQQREPESSLAIPPGQEALIERMLTDPSGTEGRCELENASIDRSVVRAGFDCGDTAVEVELHPPTTQLDAGERTSSFVIAVRGPEPHRAALGKRLAQRVRDHEGAFRWQEVGAGSGAPETESPPEQKEAVDATPPELLESERGPSASQEDGERGASGLDEDRERAGVSNSVLDALAVFYQLEWVVALLLGFAALIAARRSLLRHAPILAAVGCVAAALRVVLADFHSSDEQWAYITQAVCMVIDDARERYNLCGMELYGDSHQLGTAALFSLGYRVLGAYKATAGWISLAVGVLNALLAYGIAFSATGRRLTGAAAGVAAAAFPWAVFFSGATQTESPNDTFLLLGALFIVLDARAAESGRDGASWMTRLARSPLARALFVGMAVNVRPELLALLPALALSHLFTRGWNRDALRHVAWLLGLCVLTVPPALPGLLAKAHGSPPLGEQLTFLIDHLADVVSLLFGALWLALSVLLLHVLGLFGPQAPSRAGRVVVIFSLGMFGVYAVAQGLYAHVMRHQPHVIYHGAILWWPALAVVVDGCARGLGEKARGAVALLAAMAIVAGTWLWASHPFQEGDPAWRNGRTEQYRDAVAAVPEGATLVFLGEVFTYGGLAAPALTRGDTTVYGAAGRGGPGDEAVVCEDARKAVGDACREGRPVLLATPAGQSRDKLRDRHVQVSLAQRCGLQTETWSTVGDWKFATLACRP